MNLDRKSIAGLGIYAALVFLVAMTPVGIIPIGYINATIMHIPVIVATLLYKKGKATVIALAYGFACVLAALGMSFAKQTSFEQTLYTHSTLATIASAIVPCLTIPFITSYAYKKMTRYFLKRSRNRKLDVIQRYWAIAIAAAASTLVSSILHLCMLAIFFGAYKIWGNFVRICTSTQFAIMACEAVVAALVVPTIVVTIKHIRGYEDGHVYEDDEYLYDNFEEEFDNTDNIEQTDRISFDEDSGTAMFVDATIISEMSEDTVDDDSSTTSNACGMTQASQDDVDAVEYDDFSEDVSEPYAMEADSEGTQRTNIDEPVKPYQPAIKTVPIHTSFENTDVDGMNGELIEGVQPKNVAIMPSTRSILPRLTKEQDFVRLRIEKYMKDGAHEIAYNLLDAFRNKFSTTLTKYYVGLYGIMLCIENGLSDTAVKRLVALLAEEDAPTVELGKNGARIICGMINILCRGIVVNTLDTVERRKLEHMQAKALDYAKAGQYLLTSQMLRMFFDV